MYYAKIFFVLLRQSFWTELQKVFELKINIRYCSKIIFPTYSDGVGVIQGSFMLHKLLRNSVLMLKAQIAAIPTLAREVI